MPLRQQKFIAAWAELHKDELIANWELAMVFMQAKVECGTVVWTDDIDIAPEWLYES